MAVLTPADKFSIARLKVMSCFPYFRQVILCLAAKEQPGLGTLAVTKNGYLLYDNDILMKWTIKEIASVLVHELMHVLFDHHERCEHMLADSIIWNYAADVSINEIILGLGSELELPKGCLTTESFNPKLPKDLSAEEYYVIIKESYDLNCLSCGDPLPSPSYSSGNKKGTLIDNQKDKKDKSQNKGQKDKKVDGDSSGEHVCSNKPQVGRGWCGSGAGRKVANEPMDVGDGSLPTEADWDSYKINVAEALREAIESKTIGSVPGGFLRWANTILAPPKIPWDTKLQKSLRRAINFKKGQKDFTYRLPSRRQAAMGYNRGKPILPALFAPTRKVGVGIDTSGSMSKEQLEIALRETAGVIASSGCAARFYACDAAVHSAIDIKNINEAVSALKGGGGTDLDPVFEVIAQESKEERPDILVMITDGFCPIPQKQPEWLFVIYLLVGNSHTNPGFTGNIEVIECDS